MKSRVAVLLRYLWRSRLVGFDALFSWKPLGPVPWIDLPAVERVSTEDEGAMPQGKEQLMCNQHRAVRYAFIAVTELVAPIRTSSKMSLWSRTCRL